MYQEIVIWRREHLFKILGCSDIIINYIKHLPLSKYPAKYLPSENPPSFVPLSREDYNFLFYGLKLKIKPVKDTENTDTLPTFEKLTIL